MTTHLSFMGFLDLIRNDSLTWVDVRYNTFAAAIQGFEYGRNIEPMHFTKWLLQRLGDNGDCSMGWERVIERHVLGKRDDYTEDFSTSYFLTPSEEEVAKNLIVNKLREFLQINDVSSILYNPPGELHRNHHRVKELVVSLKKYPGMFIWPFTFGSCAAFIGGFACARDVDLDAYSSWLLESFGKDRDGGQEWFLTIKQEVLGHEAARSQSLSEDEDHRAVELLLNTLAEHCKKQ